MNAQFKAHGEDYIATTIANAVSGGSRTAVPWRKAWQPRAL